MAKYKQTNCLGKLSEIPRLARDTEITNFNPSLVCQCDYGHEKTIRIAMMHTTKRCTTQCMSNVDMFRNQLANKPQKRLKIRRRIGVVKEALAIEKER